MDEFVNDDSDEDLPLRKKKRRKGGSISGSEPEEGEDGEKKPRKKKRCVAQQAIQAVQPPGNETSQSLTVSTCVPDPTKQAETTAMTRRDRRSRKNRGRPKSARSSPRCLLVSFLCDLRVEKR